MAGKPGQSRKSGRQRLALILFGALFVILFASYAIAQGLGHPSVPSGDVAIVTHVPDQVGSVSEADFKRALLQQVAQAKLKKPPKPGEDKYEELKKAALSELLNTIWVRGEAEELDISVTPKQIATELAQIKKTNFKTPAEYKKFLVTSHFTKADVLDRVELQLLTTQIQELISKEAPPPSSSEIAELLRHRQGRPVHDAGVARRPRHRQQRQGESRNGEGGIGKRRLAGQLEESRVEILGRPDDEIQRRTAAGPDRRTPGEPGSAQIGDLR